MLLAHSSVGACGEDREQRENLALHPFIALKTECDEAVVRRGVVRCDEVWRGEARRGGGEARRWRGVAWRGVARCDEAWRDEAVARRGVARRGVTTRGEAR